MRSKLVIGVAGGTGSGKTTVANEIVERVGPGRIAVLNQDRYYRDLSHLEKEERARRNFDHPHAIEMELMVEHVGLLRSGKPAPVPIYDFSRHVRTGEVEWIDPAPVLLVEGILVLGEPALREQMDVKIYVDTDADLRVIRRLKRDISERGRTVDGVVEQYLTTVRPMHLEFVEPSKRWADVIIPEGGYNTVALELIISRVESIVGARGGERDPS
jgi:uridine kinase